MARWEKDNRSEKNYNIESSKDDRSEHTKYYLFLHKKDNRSEKRERNKSKE